MDKPRLERLVLVGTALAVWLGIPAGVVGFSEYIPYATRAYVEAEVEPVKELLISKLISDNKNEIHRLEDMQDSLRIQLEEKAPSPAERVNLERRIKRSEQIQKELREQNNNLLRCGRTICPREPY